MPPEPDAAEAARLYHSEGRTRDEVARALRVRDATVTELLAGDARPRGPRPRPDVDNDMLVAMRERDDMTWAEIADATGMSRTGARNRYLAATGQPRPERNGHAPAPG